MEQHEEVVSIPLNKISILIGEKGATKKELQFVGKIKLDINSKTGEVRIFAKNPTRLWQATQVISAIANGFPQEIARKLFKPDYLYQDINIGEFARNQKDVGRIRGRLIGRNGAAKRKIQNMAGVWLNISHKLVCIIGPSNNVELARGAIEMLLRGAPHLRVYAFIDEEKLKR